MLYKTISEVVGFADGVLEFGLMIFRVRLDFSRYGKPRVHVTQVIDTIA